ncbi:MAG: hypothetical protein ISR87_05405 [Candidatus Marinimicrobia bacterium]|nr:hypothetical protein [FCB group bacterium]MBL7024873.1 hypothetical protein [Candidatus Neomarinimicrobiota bacterium]
MDLTLARWVLRISLLLAMGSVSFAETTIQGLFNTGIYTFSRTNSMDSTLFHSRMHESISLDARDLVLKNSHFRTSSIFYMDPVNAFSNEPAFHIYTLSFETLWFDRALRVNLGRQFVYGITASRRIDGIQTTWKRSSLSLKLFAGGYLPGLGTTYSPMSDHLFGADLLWKLKPGLSLGLGISDLGRDRASYEVTGIRNGVISVTSTAQRRLGYQINWLKNNLSAYLRGRHDLLGLGVQDLRSRVTYRGHRLKSLSLEYSNRSPQILQNSIFSVFGGTGSQEYTGRAAYAITPSITAYLNVRHIQFKGNQADIYSAALGYRSIRFDTHHQAGYGGAYSHVTLSANHALRNSRIYGKVNLGNYKLLEGESRDLATVLMGARVPIGIKFQMNIEGQVLRNPYYSYDTRLYFGLRYRL